MPSPLPNLPYYAPTYFPPDYFHGGGADPASAPTPGGGRTPYNAPTYFPPAYFPGGAAGTPAPPPLASPPPGRDGGPYDALVAALDALGIFDAVVFGDPTARGRAGADSHPLAVVVPRGWEEVDDVDPVLLARRVAFTIRVVIRVEDGRSPFAELDQLAARVEARVDRADLGGGCVPALTKVRAGRYLPAGQYPEWSVELDGEFTLLVDPAAT